MKDFIQLQKDVIVVWSTVMGAYYHKFALTALKIPIIL